MSLVTSLEGWPSASTAAAGASREKRGQARSMVERAKLFSACSTLSSKRRARAPYEASWLALWNPSTLHKRGSCKRWVATCRRSSCVAAAAPQPREGTPRSRTGAAPTTSPGGSGSKGSQRQRHKQKLTRKQRRQRQGVTTSSSAPPRQTLQEPEELEDVPQGMPTNSSCSSCSFTSEVVAVALAVDWDNVTPELVLAHLRKMRFPQNYSRKNVMQVSFCFALLLASSSLILHANVILITGRSDLGSFSDARH